jgi:hypothetical protein
VVFPANRPEVSVNDMTGLTLQSIDVTGFGYAISGNRVTLTAG